MTTTNDRIAQFENMAQADPENDMAHFSLGSHYLQAERYADAAASLLRCIELNPDMSKAYQLAGEALIAAGQREEAIDLLKRGYEVAGSRGDLMPRNAMGEALESLGETAPTLSADAEAAAERLRASGAFVCQQTGRPGTKFESPPFKGPVGEWVGANITVETWNEWLGQGTKVINELRLDFSRREDQSVWDQHMDDFLGIPPEVRSQEVVVGD